MYLQPPLTLCKPFLSCQLFLPEPMEGRSGSGYHQQVADGLRVSSLSQIHTAKTILQEAGQKADSRRNPLGMTSALHTTCESPMRHKSALLNDHRTF